MKRRKTCEQYQRERIASNRDKQTEQAVSDLERQAIRERLSLLSPDREKTKTVDGVETDSHGEIVSITI